MLNYLHQDKMGKKSSSFKILNGTNFVHDTIPSDYDHVDKLPLLFFCVMIASTGLYFCVLYRKHGKSGQWSVIQNQN
jgi:hypothetical protein